MAKSYLESLLGERENVILVAHQHWFVLASSILLEVILILVIFVAAIIAATNFPFIGLIAAIGFALLLIPIATMTHDILNWSHRQYIITNWRVMQIAGIVNKNVIDSSLEKVNDIKMTQSFFGRIFDYGDIEILTASELGVNLFKRIDDPIHFKTALINAKEQLSRNLPLERQGESDNEADSIPILIAQLDKLRSQGVLTEEEFQQKKVALLAKLR